MEFDLKSYINNNEYYIKFLKEKFSLSNVEIKAVNISNGSSGGDNFCSSIYRVSVNYISDSKEREIFLIIKCMENSKGGGVVEELNMFEKERMMYLQVIPEIEKQYNNNVMLSPKCLYSTNEPIQTLVFEDLVHMNYKLENRVIGLDENHARFVLKKLAKLHAGSMIFSENNSEILKILDHGIIRPNTANQRRRNMYDTFFGQLATRCEEWNGYEDIAKKIRNINENIFEIIYRAVDSKQDKIKVINHGDMWVNNFMFKYNEIEITDLAFIDLQLSYYASLGLDINYFFNTSLQFDVLKNKREELIKYYYSCLKADLEQLNYKSIPTLNDIECEIRNKEFFGFFALAIIFPIISMDKDASKENNLDTFADKNSVNKLNKHLNTSRYIETMKYSLKRLDELGVLDQTDQK